MPIRHLKPLLTAAPLLSMLMLTACGGGSESAALSAPSNFAVGYAVKGYTFSWDARAGATRYELLEDPDGPIGPLPEAPIGGALNGTSYARSLAPRLLHERVNATYRLRACDANSCGAWTAALVPDLGKAIGYFKASNTGAGDTFGSAVALSANGQVMAVGASGERSNATCADNASQGVVCNQADDSVEGAGAVYVFARGVSRWKQVAYIKASNNRASPFTEYAYSGGPAFGTSVALSADGTTLAVGAPKETSNARGVNGDQSNTSTPGAGAVYVFKSITSATGTQGYDSWHQEAYIKATNTRAGKDNTSTIPAVEYRRNSAHFGHNVALSGDGNLLAVSAPGETSNATGVNGNQDDNSIPYAGAVYTYTRSGDAPSGGGVWAAQAYLKASNTRSPTLEGLDEPRFGEGLALSSDGTTLAVGAPYESSGTRGINGNQQDDSVWGSGAVYVFTQGGGAWSQQAYVKAHNTAGGPMVKAVQFGGNLALSADGNTLAVGAGSEDNTGAGINPPATERSLSFSSAGAAYVFARSNGTWSQQVYLKASNARQNQNYGSSLALSADGNTLAIGALNDTDGGASGMPVISTVNPKGSVHVYQRSTTTWSQRAYLKTQINWSRGIGLSGDGATLAVGAPDERSQSTGIQGDPDYPSGNYGPFNFPPTFGAVYLF